VTSDEGPCAVSALPQLGTRTLTTTCGAQRFAEGAGALCNLDAAANGERSVIAVGVQRPVWLRGCSSAPSGTLARTKRAILDELFGLLVQDQEDGLALRSTGTHSFLDDLTRAGKIRHYGVSVETVDEALKAIRYPNLETVQIIFNPFRLKPADRFFEEAAAKQVGIIVRVPLASGLLSGKLRRDSVFDPEDHRAFNREGQAFDKGETFSGVPYDLALSAVDDVRPLVPEGWTMAQFALRWILMWDAVSCTIPGARTVAQARENAAAAELPAITPEAMSAVRRIYSTRLAPVVHASW